MRALRLLPAADAHLVAAQALVTSGLMDQAETLIRAFIRPERSPRYLALLGKTWRPGQATNAARAPPRSRPALRRARSWLGSNTGWNPKTT